MLKEEMKSIGSQNREVLRGELAVGIYTQMHLLPSCENGKDAGSGLDVVQVCPPRVHVRGAWSPLCNAERWWDLEVVGPNWRSLGHC